MLVCDAVRLGMVRQGDWVRDLDPPTTSGEYMFGRVCEVADGGVWVDLVPGAEGGLIWEVEDDTRAELFTPTVAEVAEWQARPAGVPQIEARINVRGWLNFTVTAETWGEVGQMAQDIASSLVDHGIVGRDVRGEVEVYANVDEPGRGQPLVLELTDWRSTVEGVAIPDPPAGVFGEQATWLHTLAWFGEIGEINMLQMRTRREKASLEEFAHYDWTIASPDEQSGESEAERVARRLQEWDDSSLNILSVRCDGLPGVVEPPPSSQASQAVVAISPATANAIHTLLGEYVQAACSCYHEEAYDHAAHEADCPVAHDVAIRALREAMQAAGCWA